MSDPTRYRVAGNQAQLTLGGNVLIVDPAGPLVEFSDYARLKYKSECQTEGINAFNNKLREAEALNARLKAEVEGLTQLNATLSLRYDATNSMLDGCAKEIEEMEAQVERLTFDPLTYLDDQGEWMPRHTHLAAVERLKAEIAVWRAGHDTEYNMRMEFFLRSEKAEAKVERLTKAGDAMVPLLGRGDYDIARNDWKAAKEGPPPTNLNPKADQS